MSLARKSFLQLGSKTILSLLGLVSTFFIAHYLGAEVLGTIGYLLSILGIFGLFLDFGFNQAHIKRVSEGKDLGKCNGMFFSLKALFYFLFLFAIALFWIISQKTGHPFLENPVQRIVFLFLLFYFILKDIGSTIITTFQARHETVKFNLPFLLSSLTQVLCLIPLALLGYGIIALSITYFIEGGVLFIISLLFFKNYPVSRPERGYLKSYFIYALPLIFVVPLSYINDNIGRILIKAFLNFKEVGLFFAIQGLMSFPKEISSSVMMLFLPQISKLWAEQKIETLRKNTLKTLRYLSIVIIPLCVLIIFFRREIILLILGKEFLSASPILVAFAITTFFITSVRPYNNILYGISKHQVVPFLGVLGTIVLILSNLILVPHKLFNIPMLGLGGLGAAIALLNVWVIQGIVVVFLVHRYTQIGLYKKTLFHILAGLIMYGFLYLSGQISFLNIFWLKCLILLVLSLGVYGVFLILFKELTKEDIHFIKKTIHPFLMAKYIKEELNKKV